MGEVPLYKDNHLEVFEDSLLLKGYYFLRFGAKRISFSDIERFEEVRLTYFNGMARHEHTWLKPRWPFDWKCKERTEAIFLKLKRKSLGIGIAAEQPKALSLLLHKKLDGSDSKSLASPQVIPLVNSVSNPV